MSVKDFPFLDRAGDAFLRLVQHPKNIGSLDNANGKGVSVGICGDSVEVALKIHTGTIVDIKVLPHGCVYTLVCASAMSELACGRDLESALEIEPQDVATALGGLPADHMHCARLAVNTLGEAIADYYNRMSHNVSNGSNGSGT